MAFWKMLKALKSMKFEHSMADLCMYFKWTAAGFLIVWLPWIDDCACFGQKDDVAESRREMNKLFECDAIDNINEYVGCKINTEDGSIRFTQPVILQLFDDKFDLSGVHETKTPAEPGSTLPKVDNNDAPAMDEKDHNYFRSVQCYSLHPQNGRLIL